MRRTAIFFLAVLLLGCEGPSPETRPRIRVLAIEGADLDIVRGLVEKGLLPSFARILAEGAHGKLRSEAPRHAPVVFTTLATGRPADEHGVAHFVAADPRRETLLPVASFMRRTETFWEILSAKGRTVAVTGWPATWPPDSAAGTLVPDRFFFPGPDREEDVWPASAAADLLPLLREPSAISEPLLSRFVTRPYPDDRAEALRVALAAEESRRAVDKKIGPAAEVRVLWSGLLDVASHLFMSAASPRLPRITDEEFESYGQAVVAAYLYTDDLLGEAMAETGDGETLLVVSPYGFRLGIQRLRTDARPGDRRAADHHRIRGFFLAFGTGVRPGVEIRGATTLDLAPTVLALAGLPKAKDLPGRFLADAFTVAAPEEEVETYETGRWLRLFESVHGAAGEMERRIEDHPPLAYVGSTIRLSDPVNLAVLFMKKSDMRSAYNILKKEIEARPDSAIAHALLAEIHRKTREFKEAEREFREATRLDPSSLIYRSRLARVLLELGRPKEALSIVDAAISVEPADSALHQFRARILHRLGREEEAEASLCRAVQLEPDAAELHTDLGLRLLERGKLFPAASQFRMVVDLEPAEESGWNNLAVALFRAAERNRGRREEILSRAREVVDEMVERFPDYVRTWFNLAQLRVLRGEREQALADLDRALSLDPEYGAALRLKEKLK